MTTPLSALQQQNIIRLHSQRTHEDQQIAAMYQTTEETVALLAKNAKAAGFYPNYQF